MPTELKDLPPAELRAKLDAIEQAIEDGENNIGLPVGTRTTRALVALSRKLLDDLYASEAQRDRLARLLGSLGQAVLALHEAEETDA